MRRRLSIIALAGLLGLLLYGGYVAAGLPSRSEIRALATKNPPRTALMRQREEEARKRGRKPRHSQSWVPLSRVSRLLIQAVLASEDQKFFGHEGVDWDAVQRSIEKNVEKGRAARGGSTITQQLAKNLFFGTEKTATRKLRELIATRWLEADLTKTRILTLYLNTIEWGDGIYGCEAAARHWYEVPAASLTTEEAAGLVAMIPNPRRINPRVNSARHERATRRVLWLMAQAGYIAREVSGLGSEPPPEPEEPEPWVEGEETTAGEPEAPGPEGPAEPDEPPPAAATPSPPPPPEPSAS
jgi:monofunctional biosynthetic peptidoglycan transglycosylase